MDGSVYRTDGQGVGGVTTVSVVIPTWNRSSLLERSIRSALAQSHPPLEVLVCDDGSTDDTEQVVRSIGDSRVRWLPGERAGRPAVPRNRGIRAGKGEWIAFLDDDDVWLPEKLEKQLAQLHGSGCRAVCSQALANDDLNGTDAYRLGWTGPLLGFHDLLQGNRVICSTAMIHRSLLSSVQGFPEAAGLTSMEDYALWLRVATVTDFSFVSEPLAIYADAPQTSIRSVCTDAWQQKRLVLGDFIAWGLKKPMAARCLGAAARSYGEALLTSAGLRCRECLPWRKGHV